jgi:hypothetical protein
MITNFLSSATVKKWMDTLAVGLSKFANYVSTPAFQEKIKLFVQDIGILADKLVAALHILGVIPDSDSDKKALRKEDPVGTWLGLHPLNNKKGFNQNDYIKALRQQDPLGTWLGLHPLAQEGPGSAASGVGSAPMVNMPSAPSSGAGAVVGDDTGDYIGGSVRDPFALKGSGALKGRALALAGFFEKQGWSTSQTSGLLSNLISESRLDPFAVGDRGAAYGLGQWHQDRQNDFARLFGHTMRSIRDPIQAMSEELQFINYELRQGKYKSAGDALAHSRSGYAAGSIVSQGYERPANRYGEADRRGALASKIEVTVLTPTGSHVATQAKQLAQ